MISKYRVKQEQS